MVLLKLVILNSYRIISFLILYNLTIIRAIKLKQIGSQEINIDSSFISQEIEELPSHDL